MQYNKVVRAGLGLIGRDEELAELDRYMAGSGRGGCALRGEAGVGKTALISELAHRAAADGWRVLRATGVEAEQQFSLGGLNQMMYGLRDRVAGLEAHDRDILAPVFGADPAQSPSPMALAMALMNLLYAAADAQKLLLIVEDVHWLDALSATVLSAAGRRALDPRVRIVATYRPHSGVDFAGWDELAVEPLGMADASRVVDRLSLPLSSSIRQLILDFAAGNPLALEELPRCADQIDAWTSSLPLTERLVTVFGGRLRQLDAAVRTELLRAALDGARASTADSGPRYVMVDVEPAIEQDLLAVSPLGDIVFRHPLVRAAVIHQASAADRRAAHAQLALLYDDVLVRRATHLSAAATQKDQSVSDLLEGAARLSIRRGGSAVAVDWLRRAAELATDPNRRETLWAEAAFVASQAGRFDDAQAFADTAPGDESAAAVLTGAYLALYRDGEVVEPHRRICAILRDVDALDHPTMLRLAKLLLTLTMYSGDTELWRQTDAMLDRLAPSLDAETLLYRDAWGDVARRGHTVRDRLVEHFDRATGLEPWDVVRLGVTAYYVDGLADLRATLMRLFDREHERGAVTNAMTMLHLLLLDQISSGQWPEAKESARIGLELTRIHHSELFGCQFVAYDGLRAACAGDTDTALRSAMEVNAWAGPRRLGLLLGFARRIPVLTALAEGRYDDAYAAAQRICAAGDFPRYCHQSPDALLDVVQAAVHSGHHDAARAHVAEAVRLRLGEISARLEALTIAVRAMTADEAEAGGLYEAALAKHGLAAFPFEHTRVRLEYGMWLRRQRRTTEARSVLTEAADGFQTLGARPWESRARTELRAAGATVKRSAGDSIALSAQERMIAELAAAGQSNKQIAAQLYLSPRTVGAHLYRIFPKLGVTSRAGLGQALRSLSGE